MEGTGIEPTLTARLVLEDGTTWEGFSFAASRSVAGEVVFNTGMTGYPECFTDPSYAGQILVLTYPLIGNYGVPARQSFCGTDLPANFESDTVHISGLVVADYSFSPSHWQSFRTLGEWLQEENVPALYGVDTRALTRHLRSKGTMLGKIEFEGQQVPFFDPDKENLVQQVSPSRVQEYGSGSPVVAVVDCGCKANILRCLLQRGVRLVRVPWNYPLHRLEYDGLVISNGPGNPKTCRSTILQIRRALEQKRPVLGICLGHQLMALAAGANTFKMKYGHRSQNQPVLEQGTPKGWITSQNHGYAVDPQTLPPDWHPWLVNANDGTNEGLRHQNWPFLSVQFHPEASPGPVEAGALFDRFLELLP